MSTTYTPEDLLLLCAYTVENDTERIGEWLGDNLQNSRDAWVLLATLGVLFKKLNLFELGKDDLLVVEEDPTVEKGPDAWETLSACRIITTSVNDDRETCSAIINTVVDAGPEPLVGVLIVMLSITQTCLQRLLDNKRGAA